MATIRFNDALILAAKAVKADLIPDNSDIRIVRDVYGRLRFAINCNADQFPVSARQYLEDISRTLGAYSTNFEVMFRETFSNPEIVFNSPDWHATTVSSTNDSNGQLWESTISVLDRQIIGQDWLNPNLSSEAHPHRVVFYGLKGGVGRSTALAMVAYGLAREGKHVLLLDFDLESPGLSGLLLPQDQVAEFGIVDWFVEDAVGQAESILRNMVSHSPLAETTTGSISVVAAMGQEESSYLSKLARVYVDVPSINGIQRFAKRMQHFVETIEKRVKPDVVLIDSRAGLHDVAAIAITSLSDTALLFATDSAQNWLGYKQLFGHWQKRPEICKQVRDRLAIVQALAPKSDREAKAKVFLNKAYELFSSTLYDEITPPVGAVDESDIDSLSPFNPSMEDESAPHFPIRVDWDDVFQEFDAKIRPENGGVSDAEIEAKFGAIIGWVKSRVT